MTHPQPQAAAAGADVLTLLAPLSGVVVPLDQVPDQTFAGRLVGDGISVDPLSDELVAPCDGRILTVHRAAHALTLEARGLEIMIHIGLDTVTLKGEGFTPLVKAGDAVRTGDPLIRFDADLVARRAPSLLTQVLVTNMEKVAGLDAGEGTVRAGRDTLLTVRLAAAVSREAGAALPGSATSAGDGSVESPLVIVQAATGLHARPAALLAAAARRFQADVRLVKGDQDANARSVVSIMALEVAEGDTVRFVARGPDAEAAVAALIDALQEHAGTPAAGETGDAAHSVVTAPPAAAPRERGPEGALQGVAASPGIAVGNVFHLRQEELELEARAADPNQEQRALEAAIAAAHLQLETLQDRLTADGNAERAAIFRAHQELLEDPDVLDPAMAQIRDGAAAAYAWRQSFSAQAERLVALRNPLLAARATDLRDVGRRVLHLLVGGEVPVQEIPPEAIVVAEDLTPSDTAALDRTRVRGFCTTMGSATSHVAILARGFGIPAIAGIDPRVLDLAQGTRVILDGDRGTLTTAPTAEQEAAAADRRRADAERRAREEAAAAQPATTRDGHRMEVVANIGDVSEAQRVPALGGEGVGLLRSEFLFMERRTAPDEDEQARAYAAVATALGPERILVIRTLDVGGDKPLPYLGMATEANPFLGERGVRLTLNRPELFRTQIRAILRAAQHGKVAVMFPMIATLAEWRAARALVEEERAATGAPPLQIGIMVETAAAALLAEQFAREADFLSIGTNDLTQYTLAMDRTNPRLAPQVDALHPAVLRLIEATVQGGHAHGRWVGVCGALAGDAHAVPVLVGLGVDELSVDVPILPAVKARVRTLSLEECRETARAALAATDGEEVRAIVTRRHG